jgi:hypothetical protein
MTSRQQQRGGQSPSLLRISTTGFQPEAEPPSLPRQPATRLTRDQPPLPDEDGGVHHTTASSADEEMHVSPIIQNGEIEA